MITNQANKNQNGALPASITETQKSYLNAWLLMKVSAENSVPFFGKRRLKKEWEGYAKTFGLIDYASFSEEKKTTQRTSWVEFFQFYGNLCLTDATYGSMLFGLIKAKDASVKEKLGYEFDRICSIFPEELGLKELYAPLQEASEEAYYSLIK